MEIKQVGVVGCGIMGRGIAQVCAQSGYQVIISEISKEAEWFNIVAWNRLAEHELLNEGSCCNHILF